MRPAFPDTKQFVDVTNSGGSPLTISQIQINAPDVTVDQSVPLVIAAGQTVELDLKYAPTLPNPQNETPESFQAADGLVLVSNAANLPQVDVALSGQSTFNADICYQGKVNITDIVEFENLLGTRSGDANYSASADPNGDGSIDLGDFGIMNVQYGLSIAQTTSAPVAASTTAVAAAPVTASAALPVGSAAPAATAISATAPFASPATPLTTSTASAVTPVSATVVSGVAPLTASAGTADSATTAEASGVMVPATTASDDTAVMVSAAVESAPQAAVVPTVSSSPLASSAAASAAATDAVFAATEGPLSSAVSDTAGILAAAITGWSSGGSSDSPLTGNDNSTQDPAALLATLPVS